MVTLLAALLICIGLATCHGCTLSFPLLLVALVDEMRCLLRNHFPSLVLALHSSASLKPGQFPAYLENGIPRSENHRFPIRHWQAQLETTH